MIWFIAWVIAFLGGGTWGYLCAHPSDFPCSRPSAPFVVRMWEGANLVGDPKHEAHVFGELQELPNPEVAEPKKVLILVFGTFAGYDVGYALRYAQNSPECHPKFAPPLFSPGGINR